MAHYRQQARRCAEGQELAAPASSRTSVSLIGRSKAKLRPSVSSGPIRSGFFHIDIAEVQTAQGRLYLLVATGYSKFAVAELVDKAHT
jgi:hypothetical protein